MKTRVRLKRICSASGILLAGVALLVASNFMVHDIDHAPIPDAMERWGPDGYSYGYVMLAFFGFVGVVVTSVFIESLVWSVSEKELSLVRWFMVFSAGVALLGATLVALNWATWQEARSLNNSEQAVTPNR
ncbi:hypothetical protein V2O64_24575 (plasmid) [Verrucomicrobiaceae bacterium 227]